MKDSFADTVVPYFATGVENLYEIDLRHFAGSIKKYIESKEITKVIIIYNPDTIGNPNDSHSIDSLLYFE